MVKKSSQETIRSQRRTLDQQIADLQARIVAIRAREAEREARSDPALRHARSAARALEKALAQEPEAPVRATLERAHGLLSHCLGGGDEGLLVPVRARRPREDLGPALLEYLRRNPGRRGEEIAAALGTDVNRMRPSMKRLIAEGKVRTAGQRRGMSYTAV